MIITIHFQRLDRFWIFSFGPSIPLGFHLMNHLRRHASHGDDLGVHDSLPQGMRNGTTGSARPSRFSGALLRSFTVGSAEAQATTGQAAAKARVHHASHNVSEKSSALVLSLLRRISIEPSFLSQDAPTDVERTARTPHAAQDPDLQTQEGVGTILLAVGPSFDGNERSGTATSAALRPVVLALPQLVLGHVSSQDLAAQVPLGAWETHHGGAARDWPVHGGLQSGNLVSRRFVGVRVRGETKDEGKGQGGSEDPNDASNGFHAGVDGFQAIGAGSEATVQATAILPPSRTIACNGIVGKLLCSVDDIHGEDKSMEARRKKKLYYCSEE